MRILKGLTVVVGIISGASVFAGGGMDTGGVDSIAARRQQIQNLVAGMQGDIRDYLASVNLDALTIEGGDQIRELVRLGLLEDLRTSTYLLRDRCVDGRGRVVAASSRVGDRGGEICVNRTLLSRAPVVPSEVYSFIIHEHAHHLGVGTSNADESHANHLGFALGPQVAAYRYFNPRQHYVGGENPSVERPTGQCLNISTLIENWVTQGGVTVEFTQDLNWNLRDAAAIAPYWLPAGLVRGPSIGVKPVEKRFGGGRKMYQIGCEALLEENHTGGFDRTLISSFGPNFLEFFVSISQSENGVEIPAAPMKVRVSAQQGSESQQILIEKTWENRYTLSCIPRAGGLPNEQGFTEVHQVERIIYAHTQNPNPDLSALVGVSLRTMMLYRDSSIVRSKLDQGSLLVEGVYTSGTYSYCIVFERYL